MAAVIDLMPPGVRLDVAPTRAESVARYVRLEYGDRDSDWVADGRESSPRTGFAASTARRTPTRRTGVLGYLTSWFQPAERQDDGTTESAPSVDGADAPSLAR